MTAIFAFLDWIKALFASAPLEPADEQCPYCRGMGYDSSGYWCPCIRGKK
jgi:hypothetical protein